MSQSALARKWYAEYARIGSKLSIHDTIVAAVHEALEVVEEIADNWPAECLEGDGEQNCGPGIAAAIAALREGRDA